MTEQEAESNLMSEISDEMSGGVPGRETRIPECLTAYRAAVRSETLREVRSKLEIMHTPFVDGQSLVRTEVLAWLDALAQPEGTK